MNFVHLAFSAIYRKSFIQYHNIFFPHAITVNEDMVFLTKAVIHANAVATKDDVYYLYYHRPGSVSRTKFDKERITSFLMANSMIIDELNSVYDMPAKVCKMDSEVYSDLFYLRLDNILGMSFQTEGYETKYICVKAILNNYKKCKCTDILNLKMNLEHPSLFKYLASGDIKGLTDFLINTNSVLKLRSTDFRARHKNELNAT
jgi:hypothetical protein